MALEEQDPLGIKPHAPGAKLDKGKCNLDLVLGEFCNALMGVGHVGTFGANKYSPKGWIEVPNGIERYLSAALRHYFKVKRGEKLDPDSGLHHYAHMAWNILAAYELECRSLNTEVKDIRPEKEMQNGGEAFVLYDPSMTCYISPKTPLTESEIGF